LLYRRANSKNWYVRFEIGGQEIRRSAGTTSRKAAAEFENHLRERAWREIKLGEKHRLFQEAALRWLEEHEDKRSYQDDKSRMRWLLTELKDMDVRAIDGDVIAELRRKKRSEFRGKQRKGRKASGATVNRYMALLRSMLKAMEHEWGWIAKAPKVPMYPEPDKDIRWLTPDEFVALHEVLPEWLARCAAFAIETGLRAGPIRRLTWSQVDIPNCVAWVKVSQAKSKKPLRVPLTDNAIAVLENCLGHELVFTQDGEPIPQMTGDEWTAAITATGLAPLRFHDLRHTWATWHAQAGTPLHVLQKLGGWSTLAMVQKYAHLAESDLDEWARKPRTKTGTYLG
jgi:integrase